MPPPHVLSVGQCAMDHSTISRYLQREFQARVTGTSDRAETEQQIQQTSFDLVLVNRVLDGDGSLGLDLIREWKDDPALADLPVMLVSNYPDAQQAAQTLGALPGFGKATLTSPTTRGKLASVLKSTG